MKYPLIIKYSNKNNNINEDEFYSKISLNNFIQNSSKQKIHQALVAFILHQMSNIKMIQKLTEIFKEWKEVLLSKE